MDSIEVVEQRGSIPTRNIVMPLMIAVIKGTKMPWLSLKKTAVKPKHMFIRPRINQTASKAASLYCKASRIYTTIAPTFNMAVASQQVLRAVR